jgi:hypothetical protein
MAKLHSHADKNSQPWNHIQKVKEAEILDELPTLGKKMLASFTGVKPRHEGIDLVSQMVPIDNHQGDESVDKNSHDVGELA